MRDLCAFRGSVFSVGFVAVGYVVVDNCVCVCVCVLGKVLLLSCVGCEDRSVFCVVLIGAIYLQVQ